MAINRVIIEGNLTRDVEMRATASGLAVAGFTVAVILAAASISHDSTYIFARRKMTRKRALQIGFLSLLAVMFLLASFLG